MGWSNTKRELAGGGQGERRGAKAMRKGMALSAVSTKSRGLDARRGIRSSHIQVQDCEWWAVT